MPGGRAARGGRAPGVADVQLVYGDSLTVVDVAELPTELYKGSEVVRLTSVWTAGELVDDLSSVVFDFEGDDGFHPSSKGACEPYVTGEQLALGYILPDTRTIVWDDSLGFPGCYGVKATAKIIALDAP